MEDKVFELIEKMYGEFTKKFEFLEAKTDKNTTLLENMRTKIDTIAEVQQNQMTMSLKQHAETISYIETNKSLLESAIIKNITVTDEKLDKIADDIDFIKHKQHKTEEDIHKVEKQLKAIKQNDLGAGLIMKEGLQFISHKEFEHDKKTVFN